MAEMDPMFADFGPKQVEVGPNLDEPGQFWARFGPTFGRHRLGVGPQMAVSLERPGVTSIFFPEGCRKIARHASRKLSKSCSGSRSPNSTQLGRFVKAQLTLANVDQKLAKFDPICWAKFGQILPNLADVGQMLVDVGYHRPSFGPSQPMLVDLSKRLVKFVQHRPTFGQYLPILAKVQPQIGSRHNLSTTLGQLHSSPRSPGEMFGTRGPQLFGNCRGT